MTHHPEVPHGPYCYDERGCCPHWSRRDDKPDQESGYCALMEAGDWMPIPLGTMLLWDQVKECGINLEDEWSRSIEVGYLISAQAQLAAEGLPPYDWGAQGKPETTPLDWDAYFAALPKVEMSPPLEPEDPEVRLARAWALMDRLEAEADGEGS